MDQAISLKTGKKTVNVKQCDSRGRIRILQDVPFPAEVLNILGRVAIGNEPKYGIELEDLPQFFIDCRSPIPTGCVDTTLRGQRAMTIELIFNNAESFPSEISTPHSAYGLFVRPNGDFYALVGDAQCAGGNMAYTDLCCAVSYFTGFDSNVHDHPPLIPPQSLALPAVNVLHGPSDESMYAFCGIDAYNLYYIETDTVVICPSIPGRSNNARHFAKKGDRAYFNPVQEFGIGDGRRICVYEAHTGVLEADWDTLEDFHFESYYPTDDFLYVLTETVADPKKRAIKKLDLSDGSLVDSFDITSIFALAIFPVTDDLIYILSAHAAGVLYYLQDFSDLVYVGKIANPDSIEASFTALAFWNGRLYFGGNGRNIDVNSNVKSVVVSCPDDEAVVASVSRVQDSIGPGADLDVAWTDILQPDSTDRIGLYADVPGELGFVPAGPLAFVSTGALSDGSATLTIPALTPPGNYFVALVTNNGPVFIAKSAVFEVT